MIPPSLSGLLQCKYTTDPIIDKPIHLGVSGGLVYINDLECDIVVVEKKTLGVDRINEP
jgi:hypothetical protein